MSTLSVNTSVYEGSFAHIIRTFALSLLVSFIGTLVGALFVPKEFMIPLVVVEIVILISMFVVRFKKASIGYSLLYVFTFISGIVMYPAIQFYGGELGAQIVSGSLAGTVLIFGGLALYAYRSKRDFSFLGAYLFVALIGLLIVGLIGLFVQFTVVTHLVLALVGILVFLGYVLYDISQYKHGVAPAEVPLAALNLYLDFVNIFLDLLRLIWSLKSIFEE